MNTKMGPSIGFRLGSSKSFGSLPLMLGLLVAQSVPAQWLIANPNPGQTFNRLVVGGDDQVAGAVVGGFGLMASPTGTNAWRSQNLL